MDIFEWIRKNKGQSLIITLILVIVIPFAIDKVYSIQAPYAFLNIHYRSQDILAFYGIVLGSIMTIITLIETIQHVEKMHSLDYERKLTPVLDSNAYNNSSTCIIPLRILYVNIRPVRYYDRVQVLTSVDPRDMDDTFFNSQIDYLVQNISETSAVNVKVFLNGDLLHGPFSLVAGGEASIGIRFFDERGHMINEYPRQAQFHIDITYTNSNKSKKFEQSEELTIDRNFMQLDDTPDFTPDNISRRGLSIQRIVP